MNDNHQGGSGRAQPQAGFGGYGPGTRSARAHALGWVAVALALCLVVGSLAAYLKFRSVWDSITRIDVTGLGQQPPKFTSATNILVIGSDSRAGPNRKFGAGISGQRSDTIMILHILPARRGVVVLSIPRDSVVPILSCQPEDGTPGQVARPGIEQINATFAYGGPGCLWKTVEQTTQLHLDHFIELNFTGFEQVIDDVGGVSICLPFPIDDPLSKLRLSQGVHHVMGAEALAFWRARYIGEGSDLQRIRRDQYLMASVLQGIKQKDLLGSPARLLKVITDAARSMTTDSGLTLAGMITIVDSLRGLPPGAVQFIELPTVEYGPNPNWVTWPASDTALFSAIAHDRGIRSVHTTAARRPDAPAPAPAVDGVTVRVLSGSGVTGIAGQAAADLTSRGVRISGTGDAAAFSYETSVIQYPSPAEQRAAAAVRTMLGGGQLQLDPALAAGTLQVIIGAEFTVGRKAAAAGTAVPAAQTAAAAAPPASPPSLAETYGGITGSTNVCNDGAAFAGPRGGS